MGGPAGTQPGEAAEAVLYESRGSAALITINRPERRNAVDGPTAADLHEAYLRFEADDAARVLVVTGGGDLAFCAGADLKATHSMAGRLMSEEGPMGFTRLTSSKPTIAAISGYCLAGGLEIALWCDLRIATETAVLGYPERRWGVPLIDGGTQRLPRVVGLGRALDLILTGRMITAREALALGLVSRVVPRENCDEEALGLCHELCRRPPLAVRLAKEAVRRAYETTLSEGLAMERQLFAMLFATDDQKEGMRAFLEQRPPIFTGR
jgi:enoyl-CoA hydratase